MVFPFCLASTLRVEKLLPSRKRLTSYMMGTARELSEKTAILIASFEIKVLTINISSKKETGM